MIFLKCSIVSGAGKELAAKVSLLVVLCFYFEVNIAQSLFQTSLKRGPHKVGFMAGVHYDLGRPPLGRQYNRYREGRAVHISVWYPAQVKANHPRMMFSGYVDELSRMINPREVTKATRQEAIHLMNKDLSGAGGDSIVMLQHLADMLNADTHAYKNAAYQEGEYPIVIYPESPVLNSVLAEYLASYGYIVVSVADNRSFSLSDRSSTVSGMEMMIQDCQFALSVIKKEFGTGRQPLAVMGTGMYATVGLGWMMRDPTIEAMINLDGGIMNPDEFEALQHSPFFDLKGASRPMLVMYSSPEYDHPSLINKYCYADRFIVKLSHMQMNYFRNYGIWARQMPGILGPAADEAAPDFKWIAQYSLYFLDWQLKQGYHGRSFFESPPPVDNVEYSVINSLDVPPTAQELIVLRNQKGFNAMLTELKTFQQWNPSDIALQTYESIGEQLLKEEAYEDGRRWAEVFMECYPDAVAAQLLTARCYQEEGKSAEAAEMYLTALSSLQGDKYLLPGEKESTRNIIVTSLQYLAR